MSSVSIVPLPEPEPTMNWDPGGRQPQPNHRVCSVVLGHVGGFHSEAKGNEAASRTDLDSHANMPVVGRDAFVLATLDKNCEVSPFTPDYKPMVVPLVDAAVRYDCPFTGKTVILVLRNALHVPTMDHNLVPPFMLREAGIQVNDTPKIQLSDPSEEDHALTFPETGFRIPLSLWGTFSHFPTSKPTMDDLTDAQEVYLLTPTSWNPHSDVHAKNEESLLDWEGNMRQPRDRSVQVVLDSIPEDEAIASELHIGPSEQAMVDELMPTAPTEQRHEEPLFRALSCRASTGDFQMSIGSVTARLESLHLVEETDQSSEEEEWVQLEEELDDFMCCATAGSPQGVTPEHLAKVWRISHEEAKRTIDNTSQLSIRPTTATLSRNYGTNDRML